MNGEDKIKSAQSGTGSFRKREGSHSR